MPGIISATDAGSAASLGVYATLDALPADARALFADPSDDLFASGLWFETFIKYALPKACTPRLAVCSVAGKPAALLPLAKTGQAWVPLQSLTNFYSVSFRPLLSAGVPPELAGRAIGALCRRAGVVRLDALDADTPGLDEFISGLRRAGLAAFRFDHFGNWFEPVDGHSFAAYLDSRPGALRSTVRRKVRRMASTSRFAVITAEPELSEGIAQFEEIYRTSWKSPEPFPAFHPELMRRTAENGLLRLGILRLAGRAVAVQLWVLSGERAILLKLAHAETEAALSPGTVLTALMIERLLAEDCVTELDFGCGDDPYKQLWTSRRRQRVGYILADPWAPRGVMEIARSMLSRIRKGLLASPRR